jgi:hypothetical protein
MTNASLSCVMCSSPYGESRSLYLSRSLSRSRARSSRSASRSYSASRMRSSKKTVMLLVTRWSSLSHSALAALSRLVTCRRTKGMDTVFEPLPLRLPLPPLLLLLLDAVLVDEERTVSGENTRGLGGWRRGEVDSDMRSGRIGLDRWWWPCESTEHWFCEESWEEDVCDKEGERVQVGIRVGSCLLKVCGWLSILLLQTMYY